MSENTATSQRTPSNDKQVSSRNLKRAAFSGWIGSALEYYDFTLYSQAAALVFPTVFFPTSSPAVAIVASLATYGVGYVARPIGAIVLGNLADRHGRKHVLVIAMMMMGLATLLVGVLPTYSQVGILAPILLVVLRLVQGFAVAGELGASNALIVEHSPDSKRGFFASFSLQGSQIGSILALAFMLPLASALPAEAFQTWGWRIPFLLSAVVILAGYLIRRNIEEPPAYLKQSQVKEFKTPAIELFRRYPRMLLICVISTLANVIGTATLVFGVTYGKQESYGVGFTTSEFLWIILIINTVSALTIPLFGKLSDVFGRKALMITGALGGGLTSIPFLFAVQEKNFALVLILGVLAMSIFFQMWNATFATAYQEQFPTRLRVTGFAVSQNVGLMLAAFAPAIFTLMAPPGTSNIPIVIGITTLVVTVIAAGATLLLRNGAGESLAE
ncbi:MULTISPECIES: MFS transporter [Cryobacterium]|uniref:MFS transporter n=1 Tax=Cryobacterium glucosi TaxID=1259175 RepID=A0ABY2INF4_9MICO|nr:MULTISPECIES: MFS transporter [Cryobacterium]TFB98831.1 MFS transporter [Cryobacterium sp. MDB2-A-1]TFC04253.1 MFS transporter [Cryobacterium sp. MDB2-33-2]TFC14918.1 MFS transporter [Cryobacterium sp. MDB2-A-2]TFC16426.1 MFS transporter [Cryobacterium sp. MDB2-10]TFC21151.1 MFS transporter [Cryobacterium glucosi]